MNPKFNKVTIRYVKNGYVINAENVTDESFKGKPLINKKKLVSMIEQIVEEW